MPESASYSVCYWSVRSCTLAILVFLGAVNFLIGFWENGYMVAKKLSVFASAPQGGGLKNSRRIRGVVSKPCLFLVNDGGFLLPSKHQVGSSSLSGVATIFHNYFRYLVNNSTPAIRCVASIVLCVLVSNSALLFGENSESDLSRVIGSSTDSKLKRDFIFSRRKIRFIKYFSPELGAHE